MGSHLAVYNSAEIGVNTSVSPIHLKDGELLKAQNAVVDPAGAEGGLTKRGGLAPLLGSALGSSITGLVHVPLPDTASVTTTLYAALQSDAGANKWKSSTNGTSWSNATTPQLAQEVDTKVANGGLDVTLHCGGRACVSYGNKLYYAIDNYVQYPTASSTGPVINVFDGTNDIQVVRIPPNPASGSDYRTPYLIAAMEVHQGKIYIACKDADTAAGLNRSRVFQLDPDNLQVTQVATAFTTEGAGGTTGATPWAMASFLGKLWVGFNDNYGGANATGKIYSVRAGIDTAWTLEKTDAKGWITSMAVYNGLLYYGASNAVDTINNDSRVVVRSALGVYSDSDTGSATGPNAGSAFHTGLVVFNSNLYALQFDNRQTTVVLRIRKFDGTTWTTDYDIQANEAARNQFGMGLVIGSALYYVIAGTTADGGANSGRILRLTAGGAWTNVLNAQLRGFIGYVKT